MSKNNDNMALYFISPKHFPIFFFLKTFMVKESAWF